MYENASALFGLLVLPNSEVAKAILAAALALGVAVAGQAIKWRLDYLEQQRKRIVAGNLALATLRSYYNNFQVLRDSFAKRRQSIPPPLLQSHPWLEYHTWPYRFSDPPAVNYDGLDFLFKGHLFRRGSHEVFAEVINAEQRHRDLISLYDLHIAAGRKAYELLTTQTPSITSINQANVAVAESAVGRQYIHEIVATLDAVRTRFKDDDVAYGHAIYSLRNEMVKRFKERNVLSF